MKREEGEIRHELSKGRFEKIILKHKIWKNSHGLLGDRCKIKRKDLRNIDNSRLKGEGLSKIILIDCDLSGLNIREARLENSDLDDSIFRNVRLQEAGLQNASLVKADFGSDEDDRTVLDEADLRNANLKGASLSGASLQKADLRDAIVAGADFSGADLRDADLRDAVGIHIGQFGRADLTNALLPQNITTFEGLQTIKAASQSAQKLFVTLLVACGYAALAITTTGSGSELKLPIIQSKVPIRTFYIITPILLVFIFIYFHLQMQRVWDELSDLPAIFPDGKPLDQRIHPWLVTTLVRSHLPDSKVTLPPFYPMLQGVVVIMVWCTVPVTVFYFGAQYSIHYSWLGSLTITLLFWLSATWAYVSYQTATDTLDGTSHKPLHIPLLYPKERGRAFWESHRFWYSVGGLVLLLIVWAVLLFVVPTEEATSASSAALLHNPR